MTTATDTPRHKGPKPLLGGCGGCSYTYNPQTGCYDRQGTGGCTGACQCAAMVCGAGAQVIQKLRPATVSSALAVSLSCFAVASETEWLILALADLAAQQQQVSRNYWRAAAIGLAILSLILAIGLAAALLYR